MDHVAHRLPAQGPITVFVHHNTLHAFEDRPFEQAVVEAGQLFGCEPFLAESTYRDALTTARIREDDLQAALDAEQRRLGEDALLELLPGISRRELLLRVLRHGIAEVRSPELDWLLAESDATARCRDDLPQEARQGLLSRLERDADRELRQEAAEREVVGALWASCARACNDLGPSRRRPVQRPLHRARGRVLASLGVDIDALTQPLIIRFTAAFLDQGVAYWPLPDRSLGFYPAFLALYGQRGSAAGWMDALPEAIAQERLVQDNDELASIARSLAALGEPEERWEDVLVDTALALRGWAGMVRQIQVRSDRVLVHAPPASLAGFLAVQLLVERTALRWVLSRAGCAGEGLAAQLAALPCSPADVTSRTPVERAWVLFQVCQLLGLDSVAVDNLGRERLAALLDEVERFDDITRRRIFHVAYERTHRLDVLDALALHRPAPSVSEAMPLFQAVFCIDEREESLRRHLEEVEPRCETYGVAGFFGVAMYFRGLVDAHPRPLCPAPVRPQHEVREVPQQSPGEVQRLQARSRRALGELNRGVGVGSHTLVRGTLLTALLGAWAALPLVFRVLFPRFTAHLRRRSAGIIGPPRATRLALERDDQETVVGKLSGYTVEEMASVVQGMLRTIGLQRFSPLVIVVGHGSSSLNNPHESAYDCGACGGGRGGPNARAFAQMANAPRVRALLAERGLAIPEETCFVGVEHNTSDDAIVVYDADHLPEASQTLWRDAHAALDQARARNAHERCRRFANVPVWWPPLLTLAHVEGRAEDLAQPRPECGHATNAVCIVGRRARTRGLFLDRRAFLVSYDPERDDADGTVLAGLLAAVVPVVAGISLEYYFGYVDSPGYGCGTKLPHNISGLLGVMDGHASDLRTGLPWQMVEIHEPVRLVLVVEAKPALLRRVLAGNPGLGQLVAHRWVQFAALDPDGGKVWDHVEGELVEHRPRATGLAVVPASAAWYRGQRGNLAVAVVSEASSRGAAEPESSR